MKTLSIDVTKDFLKSAKKLTEKERRLLVSKRGMFLADPFNPQLRTHKLRGKFGDRWAFSVNYSVRVIFRFMTDDKVIFLDVGTHRVYK